MATLTRSRRGFSLVLVLILLGALALGAAHTLQSAGGSEKVATSFRMQGLARESAEAVLRFCESQLLLPDAQRLSALRETALPLSGASAPAWADAAIWASGAPVALPAHTWSPWPAGTQARAAPVCLVEKQPLGSAWAHVVTARGFSPDWRGDALAATVGGSAVWLQSWLLIHDGRVRDRVQRRIIQPPLR
jgi:hypothetical protein